MIKKNIKVISAFILGAVCALGLTISAYVMNGKKVLVKVNGWNVKNVEEAVNYLKNENTCAGLKPIPKIGKLKTAAHDKTPAMYEIDPGDEIKRNFYVLEDNGETVDLIMDRNITDTVGEKTAMSWNDAMVFFTTGAGASLKTTWTNVLNIDLPKATTIAKIAEFTNWTTSSGVRTFDTSANSSNLSKYAWLFNYTRNCAQYGCDPSTSPSSGAWGYWTQDKKGSDYAWDVYWSNALTTDTLTFSSGCGVRPVITVRKENL